MNQYNIFPPAYSSYQAEQIPIVLKKQYNILQF